MTTRYTNFTYRAFFKRLVGGENLTDWMVCRVFFCGRDHASTPEDETLESIQNLDCIHPDQEFWLRINRRIDGTGDICFEADDSVFRLDPPATKFPCFCVLAYGTTPMLRFSISMPLKTKYERLELRWMGTVNGAAGRVMQVSSCDEELLD